MSFLSFLSILALSFVLTVVLADGGNSKKTTMASGNWGLGGPGGPGDLVEKWLQNPSTSETVAANGIDDDCSATASENLCLALNDTALRWYSNDTACQPYIACKVRNNGNSFTSLDACDKACGYTISSSTKPACGRPGDRNDQGGRIFTTKMPASGKRR